MVRVDGVRLEAGGRAILDGIDLVLTERRIGIVGANGSGKSSLARLVNGLRLPTQGRVETLGHDTRTDTRALRAAVGFVFQNPDSQIVFPVVDEDVAFGPRNFGLSGATLAARVDEALERLGIGDLRMRQTHLLSGGEKQLLALAGVLAMRPRLVVLDEPTTLLDLRNRRRVAAAIDALEMPVIVVTHDLELLHDFDRVVVMSEGRVAADDAPGPALSAYVEALA